MLIQIKLSYSRCIPTKSNSEYLSFTPSYMTRLSNKLSYVTNKGDVVKSQSTNDSRIKSASIIL
jgi:hypothetical protein